MKISDVNLSIFGINKFRYTGVPSDFPRLALPKTQYTYRLMLPRSGRVKILFEGKEITLDEGDALFLLPLEQYRIIASDEAFSLISVFFDPMGGIPKEGYSSCVFLNSGHVRASIPKYSFDSLPCLSHGAPVKGAAGSELLTTLFSLPSKDPIALLCAKSLIFGVMAARIKEDRGEGVSDAADRIIDYIRAHPEENHTPDSLGQRFSYSKLYVGELVKKRAGCSLSRVIRAAKMDYAKNAITEGGASLTALALSLGYFDYSHFYKAFVSEYGVSPGRYMKELERERSTEARE